VVDDSFLLLFNAHFERVTFHLPARRFGARWLLELSTADPEAGGAGDDSLAARAKLEVESRSLVLLRRDA
jgi:isoamylase